MPIRLLVMLAVLIPALSAPASASRPLVDGRVEDGGGMCWVPDIEFPVPCDEDEDD